MSFNFDFFLVASRSFQPYLCLSFQHPSRRSSHPSPRPSFYPFFRVLRVFFSYFSLPPPPFRCTAVPLALSSDIPRILPLDAPPTLPFVLPSVAPFVFALASSRSAFPSLRSFIPGISYVLRNACLASLLRFFGWLTEDTRRGEGDREGLPERSVLRTGVCV